MSLAQFTVIWATTPRGTRLVMLVYEVVPYEGDEYLNII